MEEHAYCDAEIAAVLGKSRDPHGAAPHMADCALADRQQVVAFINFLFFHFSFAIDYQETLMATLNGTEGDDVLRTTADGDVLNGLGGSDQLFTPHDFSTLKGGSGNDFLHLDSGIARTPENNVLNGGEGDDQFGVHVIDDIFLMRDRGNYNIFNGDAGDDEINSMGDGNTLNGGDGNDWLIAAGRDNALNGGAGADRLDVAGESNSLNGDAGDDVLAGIGNDNNFNGGSGNDELIAQGSTNTLFGGEGDDALYHTGGDASGLFGGDGNDYVEGNGSHESSMSGDAGDDTLVLVSGFLVAMGGGDGNDHLIASGWNIGLDGGDGNDIIEGTFAAQDEGTAISLQGGNGDDILIADANARMTGGAGSDTFVLRDIDPDMVITDFRHASAGTPGLQEEDVLDIEAVLEDFSLDKPLGALVGQGYLALDYANVGGEAALDTVVRFDPDGSKGSAAPGSIVALLDTTLTTHGQDVNNWIV